MSPKCPDPVFPEDSDELIFAPEDTYSDFDREDENDRLFIREDKNSATSWKILLIDDDEEIHQVTKLALEGFSFDEKSLIFLSAYSAQEAKKMILENPDTALILLDVVMETEFAGLDVVKYIRDNLKNLLVRIILRTGQPGHVPEDVVIVNYDINDYKTKTELTTRKLFTALVAALRSFSALKKLEESRKELEKIAAASARFVPTQFLQLLNKQSIVDIELGDNVEKEMSVLFADIRNFTSLSERITPEENFKFLNSFFSFMEPAIAQNNGFIDKYIGDAIMALFNGGADDALQAGISMLHRLNEYNQKPDFAKFTPVKIGIGINSGNLMLGTVGGLNRMDGTVISDTVNLGARIESLTKNYGVSLLITHQTFLSLKNANRYYIRTIDRVKIKGKSELITVHEVFDADPPHVRQAKQLTKTTFEQALVTYHLQDFERSMKLFQQCLQENPEDTVAATYQARCQFQF